MYFCLTEKKTQYFLCRKKQGKTQCFLGRKKQGKTIERTLAGFAQALEWAKKQQKKMKIIKN